MANSPRDFIHLRPNWDSYGARPISEAAILTAESLEYVPTSPGGVQIEFHAGGMEIEIEIHPEGHVESVLVSPALNQEVRRDG